MNWDMIGQAWAVSLLKEHIATGGFRHAYLFSGAQGIGRRTLALRFAQALNCPQPPAPGEPCRVCRTCTQIEKLQHPDLAVVQAERIGGNLKVEQIRELQHFLSLSPYQAPYRVAILLRFEEANLSAANALLKTLEEPPPQVVLLLTAESSESLLPTISSRCENIRLRPLGLEVVEQGLIKERAVPADQARLLAHISGGRIGYALQLWEQPGLLDRRNRWLEDHQRLLSSSRVERFTYAENLAKDKDNLQEAIESWSALWRDVFLQTSGSAIPVANLDHLDEIKAVADQLEMGDAVRMLTSLQRTQGLLKGNINPRMALEVLMLDLPRLAGNPI